MKFQGGEGNEGECIFLKKIFCGERDKGSMYNFQTKSREKAISAEPPEKKLLSGEGWKGGGRVRSRILAEEEPKNR